MAEVESEIRRLEAEMLGRVLAGEAVERYFSRNFVRVGPDGRVAELTDPEAGIRYARIEVSEHVLRVSGSTAVSVSRTVVKGTRAGVSFEGAYRAMRTWAKEAEGWKVVAFSTTPIVNKSGSEPSGDV